MPSATELRRELSARNLTMAEQRRILHELTAGEIPSVIFGRESEGRHGNFHQTSYRNILANPRWAGRLTKVHTASRRSSPRAAWRWMELDCANSSDALLMNIFCYTRTLTNRALAGMLGISALLAPEFGFKPRIPLRNGKTDQTEIDMKVGELLVEAKLTETDFQTAPLMMIDRYRDLEEVFDYEELRQGRDVIPNYQLIRGTLAAFATGASFRLLCDARRPQLIENWYSVMRAVKTCELRCRLQLLTWQELASVLPRPLQKFLAMKYGILH
jgi:hypothetical protein